MKHKSLITLLVILIVLLAILATSMGIFTHNGNGSYQYLSIRNQQVSIYGKGLYKHMSAEVAPQGIAQDYVTLFIAVPLLIFSCVAALKGSLRGQFLLTGTQGYFLVTYLFYTVMGMYNAMFLVYVVLMGTSFYAFLLNVIALQNDITKDSFSPTAPVKWIGSFLVFVAAAIALLWLSIVVPPLLDGSIIPVQVEHYTTLIVQALDLGILLPAAAICGVLIRQRSRYGFLLAPVYFIFLSLLMTALTAKVLAMKMLGYNVTPVIFIIPAFNVLTVTCTVILLKHLILQKEPTLLSQNQAHL